MDDIAYLIREELNGRDGNGNAVINRIPRRVYCQVDSITRAEFYAAGTDDIKPEFELSISNLADYQGEKLVRFHNDLYDVIRSYWRGDKVTLVVAAHVGIVDDTASA